MYSCSVCSAWGCTRCMLEEPVYSVPKRPDDTRKKRGTMLICQSCCDERRAGWKAHPQTAACQTCSFVLNGVCTEDGCGRVSRLRAKPRPVDTE